MVRQFTDREIIKRMLGSCCICWISWKRHMTFKISLSRFTVGRRIELLNNSEESCQFSVVFYSKQTKEPTWTTLCSFIFLFVYSSWCRYVWSWSAVKSVRYDQEDQWYVFFYHQWFEKYIESWFDNLPLFNTPRKFECEIHQSVMLLRVVSKCVNFNNLI